MVLCQLRRPFGAPESPHARPICLSQRTIGEPGYPVQTGSRFIRDSRTLAIGVFVAQVIAVAISPILTRLFSPTDFGVFSVVVATSTVVGIFSTLRLESIIAVAPTPAVAIRLLHLLMGAALAMTAMALVAMLAFSSTLGALLSLPAGAEASLLMLPLLIFLFAFYSGVRAWCLRQRRFATVGTAQVGRAVAAAATGLSLGFAGLAKIPGLALLIGQASGDLIFSIMLARPPSRREARLLLAPRWSKIQAALLQNAQMVRSLVLSQTLIALYGRLPILVIASVYGTAEAGFYAFAEMLVAAPSSLISSAIGDVYRQRAAAYYRACQSFDGIMLRVLALTLTLSVVPFTLAILLTPHYFGMIFGLQWQPATFTVTVLLVGALVAFNSTPVDKAAVIVGAHRYILLWHAVRFMIEVLSAVAAVSDLIGYEGYLVAVVTGRGTLHLIDIVIEHRLAGGKL